MDRLGRHYAARGDSIESDSSLALVGTGDNVLIAGLITTGDSGEFVVRPLGDRGYWLKPRTPCRGYPLRWLQRHPLLAIHFLSCLSRRFPYFHPESIKKSELSDLKREF
jgi:hypothetical protein